MDLETCITVLLAELQELRHDIAALNDEVTGLHNSVARFSETAADNAAEPKPRWSYCCVPWWKVRLAFGKS